ncbi:hypothetical protein MRX96_013170 [Rhipicephalus microplus]
MQRLHVPASCVHHTAVLGPRLVRRRSLSRRRRRRLLRLAMTSFERVGISTLQFSNLVGVLVVERVARERRRSVGIAAQWSCRYTWFVVRQVRFSVHRRFDLRRCGRDVAVPVAMLA